MSPAFSSYILWGGRKGCRERIDVSCWEVNYSNSWLQGAPTVMNPSLLCGCQGKGSLWFSVGKPWLCWCVSPLLLEGQELLGARCTGIRGHECFTYWHTSSLLHSHNLHTLCCRNCIGHAFKICNGNSKGLIPPLVWPKCSQAQLIHWSH